MNKRKIVGHILLLPAYLFITCLLCGFIYLIYKDFPNSLYGLIGGLIIILMCFSAAYGLEMLQFEREKNE